MRGTFALVRKMLAQDPAYRPTCWPLLTIVPGVRDPGGLVYGSSKRQRPHRPRLHAIGRHQRPDLLGGPLLTFLPLVRIEEIGHHTHTCRATTATPVQPR